MRRKRKGSEGVGSDVLSSGTEAPGSPRITPVDIQQKEFRLALRGYNERDVDQFLDEVTEEMARLHADNRRLRDEADFTRTSRLDARGATDADAIVRQAREEATRIVGEAQARASATGPGPAPTLAAFAQAVRPPAGPPVDIHRMLARERAFLQNLANLIQAHAEGVKDDVRRARDDTPAPPRPAPAEPAPAPEDGESHVASETLDEPTDAETSERARPAEGDDRATPVEIEESAIGAVDDQSRSDPDRTPPGGSRGDPGWPGRAEPPSPEHVVDLTAGEWAREGGQGRAWDAGGAYAVPPREAHARVRAEATDDPEEPSIRELFWGEE